MRRPLLCAAIPVILFVAVVPGESTAGRAAAASCGAWGAPDDSTLAGRVSDSLAVVRIEASGARLGSGDLREPVGLAADSRGFVYVADAMAGKVFRYGTDGGSLEFERPQDNASFYPIDVAVQESFVLVLDYSTNALLRYDYRGTYLDVLISFDRFEELQPVSISSGADGRILVTDIVNHAIAALTPLLDVELAVGEFGWGQGRFNEPRKAIFLPDQRIAVVESGNHRVQLFSPAGTFERVLEPPEGRQFVSPRSICADVEGNIFVADSEGSRISVFSGGSYLFDIDSYGGQAISPSALALDWSNTLYAADLKSRSILIYHLFYLRRE